MTVPHKGKGWQLAPALIALEAEADRIAPRRRRTSDGSIGDQAHRARKSNHNPDGGFVDAFDLSHDPENGMDAHGQVRAWVARQDPRLEEVISNRRIWTYERRRDGWRPYKGSNPHTQHAHITVKNTHRFDRSPWFGSVVPIPTGPTPPPYRPPAPAGPAPADLKLIQRFLQEDDDMIIIRDGIGIALLVNSKCVGQSLAGLAKLREEYKRANRPLVEHQCASDAEWLAYGGWARK